MFSLIKSGRLRFFCINAPFVEKWRGCGGANVKVMPLSLTKKKSIIVTFVTCCHVSIHCYSLFILCGVFWYGAWPGWKCDVGGVCVKNKMTHVQIAQLWSDLYKFSNVNSRVKCILYMGLV